jgi:hypothetical protein
MGIELKTLSSLLPEAYPPSRGHIRDIIVRRYTAPAKKA